MGLKFRPVWHGVTYGVPAKQFKKEVQLKGLGKMPVGEGQVNAPGGGGAAVWGGAVGANEVADGGAGAAVVAVPLPPPLTLRRR